VVALLKQITREKDVHDAHKDVVISDLSLYLEQGKVLCKENNIERAFK